MENREETLGTQDPQFFDLNIGEILEAWQPRHAVREVIANALDEQALTGTADVIILETMDGWVVRDHGRGLRYEHLRQNENAEKLSNSSKVIGKFGLGLKDALATLHRRHIDVEILTPHGDITVTERHKHGLDREIPTLHAVIHSASNPQRVGTEVVFRGLNREEIVAAKGFFLRFSGDEILGRTPHGDILRRVAARPGRIYVKGLLVAEEESFAFSYNITSLTAAMSRALNRERTNVGRTAYAERVKAMLLACDAPAVVELLAEEIAKLDKGTAHDEVKWTEVAVHACKILNQTGKFVFLSSSELEESPDMVDQARSDGYGLVPLPDSIRTKLYGMSDCTGATVRGLDVFAKEWADGFQFVFLAESQLTGAERAIFGQRAAIAALVGGLPQNVREILVSTRMRPREDGKGEAVGLWEPTEQRIIIKRSQLCSMRSFAGTLLHEIVHAHTGEADVSRAFELALTDIIGELASVAVMLKLRHAQRPAHSAADMPTPSHSISRARSRPTKPRNAKAKRSRPSRKDIPPKSGKRR